MCTSTPGHASEYTRLTPLFCHRRYWDNIYGGKLGRYERQIHHYGSGLNALPLIAQFEKNPTDYHLIRTGFAGLAGALSNIDQGGFASASFHSFPDTLKWDGYSGDYGPNFSGHAMGTGTFIINHPDFGWQAFGGNIVSSSSTSVQVAVTDSARRKVFIASLGARFELDAGVFTTVDFKPSTRSVVLGIAAAPSGVSGAAAAPNGRLLIKQTATVSGVGTLRPTTSYTVQAGAFVVPFSGGTAAVTVSA